jgi:hypothetical protein
LNEKLERVAELERELLRLIEERDALHARWKRGRG